MVLGVPMENRKPITTRELLELLKVQRKQPISRVLIEKFNKIAEMDERVDDEKSKKKTARSPEATR